MSQILASGTQLGGYRVESLLGRGGMGVVYEATQLSLGRKVALKLLAPDLSADEGFRVRFQREARIQAGIDHAHIVSVYEAGELEGEGLYIAMQIVRGPNLKELVRSGDLDPARVLRLLTPVADALDTAHEADLVHRDIKPHNILVGRRDHAYLADFGLTRRPGDTNVTRTGAFVGTLDYAAPEQIEGAVPTARTDVYSFGALAFECLTGSVPFPRRSEAAVMLAHLTQEPPHASEVCGDLSQAVDAALQRALAKAPAARQASALELMAELQSALQDVSPYQVPRSQPSTARTSSGDTLPLDDAETPSEPTLPVNGAPPGQPIVASAPTRPRAPAVAPVPPPAPSPAGERTELRSHAGALTRDDPRAGREAVAPRTSPTAAPRTSPTVAPATAPARARARPRRRLPVPVLIGAAAVPVAAVLGIVLGGSGSDSPTTLPAAPASRTMSAGALKVAVPASWRNVSARQPQGLELKEAQAVAPRGAPAGEAITIGRSSGGGATLLPAAFVRALPAAPQGEPVKLGALEAYRHAGLRPRGAPATTVYAAPTTDGVATVACVGDSVARSCAQVASTLRVDGARPVPLGPHAAYAKSVGTALAALTHARTSALKDLGAAHTRRGQGKAADAIASAYGRARSTLLRAPLSPLERDAHARLLAALQDAQTAWKAMGSAAANGDGERYANARRLAGERESAVRKAVGVLERLGYDVR